MRDQAAAGHVVGVAFAMVRVKIRVPVGVPAHSGRVLACGFRRDIGFDADDWLDARIDCGAPHLIGAMHVAMIRDADGLHVQFLGAFDQIRYLRSAVEQRIVRMVMQLHEVSGSSHALQSTYDS